MWVYLQDRFVPKEEAVVSIFDHGFLYGDGLFETFRAYRGKIFRLDRHLTRLARSAERLALSIPPLPRLEEIVYQTLERNRLEEALLRLTISRGAGEIGLDPGLCEKPTLIVTARPFSGYPKEDYQRGVSAVILQIRRNIAITADPAVKSLSFLDNVIGKIEAKRRDAFEGIFLNAEGNLTEGTISNLFWVRNGVLETPLPEAGLLEGITREVVINLATNLGISVREGLYSSDLLFQADEAFLTNSGLELMPLTEVDHRPIGDGRPGPITLALHQAFRDSLEG